MKRCRQTKKATQLCCFFFAVGEGFEPPRGS